MKLAQLVKLLVPCLRSLMPVQVHSTTCEKRVIAHFKSFTPFASVGFLSLHSGSFTRRAALRLIGAGAGHWIGREARLNQWEASLHVSSSSSLSTLRSFSFSTSWTCGSISVRHSPAIRAAHSARAAFCVTGPPRSLKFGHDEYRLVTIGSTLLLM